MKFKSELFINILPWDDKSYSPKKYRIFQKVYENSSRDFAIYYNNLLQAFITMENKEAVVDCYLVSGYEKKPIELVGVGIPYILRNLVNLKENGCLEDVSYSIKELPFVSQKERKQIEYSLSSFNDYCEQNKLNKDIAGLEHISLEIDYAVNNVEEKEQRIKQLILSRLEQMPDEIKELVAELNEKTDIADDNDKGIAYKLGSKK